MAACPPAATGADQARVYGEVMAIVRAAAPTQEAAFMQSCQAFGGVSIPAKRASLMHPDTSTNFANTTCSMDPVYIRIEHTRRFHFFDPRTFLFQQSKESLRSAEAMRH